MKDRVSAAKTTEHIDKEVTLAGWVHTRRDHGKLVFVDLRDRSGIVQVVFHEHRNQGIWSEVQKLRPEFVVCVKGEVRLRSDQQINPEMPTGKVEIVTDRPDALEILNESETPPFEIDSDKDAGEEIRMTYRYLDLRRAKPQTNLELRHNVVKFIRDFMDKEGFWEIETPALTKGTPEGAREYVVPSRLHHGKYYVLPQSPQQFKQLLMVAGIEKYFQIARCYRDEDPRGDRQPEHTQLDLEMSFVEREEVLDLIERCFTALVKEVTPNKKITAEPWPVLTYDEAMKQYGTDKPDLRKDKNDPDELAFCFVIDFPMFEKTADGKITSQHHPFCMPHKDDLEKIESDPLAVRADSYDLVLNGTEMASGSVRIHRADIQKKVFSALGLSDEQIQSRFGHILKAFSFGAPPHAGIAPGIDRLVMVLAGEPNIREVMAFPKTGDGRDLMMGAPSDLDPALLKELGLPQPKDTPKK
jgi:aspartyl-tRNA synthetase